MSQPRLFVSTTTFPSLPAMSKRSNSPSSSGSFTSKNFCLAALGNSDDPSAEVSDDSLSFHDILNAATQLRWTPSSFGPEAKTEISETQNWVEQVVMRLDFRIKQCLLLAVSHLGLLQIEQRRSRQQLADAQIIYQYEVFETLLQAVNNIIFNPDPTPEERKHRGSRLLTEQDVETLKKKRQMNITDIIRWKPKPANAKLKEKALSCLTKQQRRLAHVLITPAIRNLNHEELYCIGKPVITPRTSQSFAKATVEKVFNDLNLGSEYPGLCVSDFNDLIENAPSPLVGDDPRPLFLVEDDNPYSPEMLMEEVAQREDQIHCTQERIVSYIVSAARKFANS